MTHPVGSLLFDTYDNTYLIVVDDNYDEQGEEGAFVNYATHMSGGRWDDRAVRFRQARPLLKWDGSWGGLRHHAQSRGVFALSEDSIAKSNQNVSQVKW